MANKCNACLFIFIGEKKPENILCKGPTGGYKLFLFSSPEHNMLKGSFRVVLCTSSCFFNNFFNKRLFLPNRLANLDQTWQECSLGGPPQKLFTGFDSIKNSNQFFKNLLLWNCWSDFEIISVEFSLADPFKNCSRLMGALVNGRFLHNADMKKFLKNLLP